MDKSACGVPEERWIDWHLGRLLPAEAESLRRHRENCPACAEHSRKWAQLLGVAEPAADLAPRRKERLRREARRRGIVRRASRTAAAALRRPAGLAIAGCALALLAFGGFLYYGEEGRGGSEEALAPQQYAEQNAPEAADFMGRADTVVYSMSPGGDDPLPGGLAAVTKETVWINVRTHELFLLMEGMLPSDDRDVQAWAKTDGGEANLGLLKFHQNRAHLYAAHVQPELWDSLMLTIEPKGGSERPTSPRTAALLLR